MNSVLIVDDATVMRIRLKEILFDHFNVVGEADNGIDAIDMYVKLRPDIVTMDITMNHLNGINALEHILDLDSNAKIIMVSAMGQKNIVLSALQKGAKDFIIKPFDPGRVLCSLKRVLE